MVAREVAMKEPGNPVDGRKLRISYLFPQFPVRTQVFAISDIAALRAQGHAVAVHTMKPPPRNEAALLALCEVPGDLPIMRPTLRGALRWPALVWKYRQEAAKLAAEVIKSAPSSPAVAASAFLCIPRVLEVLDETRRFGSEVLHVFWARHIGMTLAASGLDERPVLRSAFVGAYDLVADDFLVDMTLGSADVVFSHAEANRAYAESKVSGVPVHIVHRGIPLPPAGDDEDRDPNRWITASALVPEKNVEAVLRLFATARARQPELTLSVFGDGPDRQRLESLAVNLNCADAVDFAGHVSRSQLFAEMQRSGTFLLLSKKASERLPNVLKEALWGGCAVIASPSEGIEELIPDDSIGAVVVDPDDLASAFLLIRPLLDETGERANERRKKARQHIAENFSSDQSMSRYVGAWRQSLRAKPSPKSAWDRPSAKIAAAPEAA
ncbi:glycosyltransferase involved in cell wall biosynthesis [Sphingomonas sp. F9_3S_D5_B_2]